MTDDPLGDTAQQVSHESAAPVRSHYDHFHVFFGRNLHDPFGWMSFLEAIAKESCGGSDGSLAGIDEPTAFRRL